ncbi:MAG TPA: vitamin B12 dependent-methionine synthase activation domain-containing protein, partial [bacterium]|nr:vitamin B12 dependent-methionine synthase activation domain-containing protein [bacterium]
KLMNQEMRPKLEKENRELQRQLVASYQARDVKLAPLAEARARKFQTDWTSVDISRPSFTGVKTLRDYPLEKIVPYIDWSPFFMTYELKGKFPRIFEDPHQGPTARQLYDDGRALLERIMDQRLLQANAVYGFWPAGSDGDDIVLFTDESRETELARFHTLRQQWERQGQKDFRALADYVAPLSSGRQDYLGAFAVTAGVGADKLCAEFDKRHEIDNSILVKALADRLAEAFAELVHALARRDWGFGKDENLSPEDLIEEKYRGIRPAAGYPSQPDHTEKEILFRLLEAETNAGITLTESFAMWPAASVSGLYFAHPQARYFALDRITREQVSDYARRKGMTLSQVERWLAPNLGYEP